MTISRKVLLALLLAGALAPAPAQAAVTVRIDGTDSGDNPHDTLTVTGDDTQDIIDIREGFEGDVGPNGAPDSCGGGDRLCFLTVEANKAITAQGACQRAGSERRVRCAYFHSGTARSTHAYRATVNLGGGSNDRVRIVQDAVADCCQAVTTPWNWTIDFGPGSDLIDGANVLSVPDNRGTLEVKILGGLGNDIFTGTFDGRPTRLFGDDDRNVVNLPDGDDAFNTVDAPMGLSLNGEGGRDGFFPASTSIPIDAGAGDDVVGLGGASFDTSGPPAEIEGGAGRDKVTYGPDAPAVTVRLDGSSASTGNQLLTDFEDVVGSRQGDSITGNDSPNRLDGGGGSGDSLRGRDGNDVLDVDDGVTGPAGAGGDDAADGGAGEDLILANDGVVDLVSCGSSSHSVALFNQSQELFIFDSDRAQLDLLDAEADCEEVERQAVRTPPAARIARATLAGARLRVALRCPRGARDGCRGRARAKPASPRGADAAAAARRYRVRRGGRGVVLVPLPAAARRAVKRRGWAVLRVETSETDSSKRPRTRSRMVLLSRR
jgi:hypothetical protein